MSAAKVDSVGKVTRLDGKAEPDEVVTEANVQEPAKLARLLGRALSTIATLRRAWSPSRIDFEDCPVVVATGTTIHLEHGFGGRVRWWFIDMSSDSTAKVNVAATTSNTLSLDITPAADGTVSIRVEQAG